MLRRIKRPDALQGTLDLLVLKTLSRGPQHGYGIAAFVQQASDDMLRVEEGSLYPALHRLEEAKLVKAKWATTANNRRARVYEITAAGRRQLEADEQRWKAVMLALHTVLDQI
jgi:PadR family transcriptional regulator PadR